MSDIRPGLEYWAAKLAGEEVQITEDVQEGYYRGTWYKDSGQLPIAIWKQGDQLYCLVGYSAESGKEPAAFYGKQETVEGNWLYFCESPVEYADYQAAFTRGEDWPDVAVVEETPPAGHNQPPLEGVDLYKQQMSDLMEAVTKHLKVPKAEWNQIWADKCANYRSKVLELRGIVEKERVEKKKPHDDAANAVQAIYKPVVDDGDRYNKKLRDALSAFKNEEDRKAKEKMLAELKEVEEGNKTVDEAEIPKEVKKAGGSSRGGTGRATGFREVRSAKITDYDKALAHFAKDGAVVGLIQSLCDRACRSGDDKGPGWEVELKKQAG